MEPAGLAIYHYRKSKSIQGVDSTTQQANPFDAHTCPPDKQPVTNFYMCTVQGQHYNSLAVVQHVLQY